MKMTGELAARCELALMGKVQKCKNHEVQDIFNYMKSACGYSESYNDVEVLDRICEYSENSAEYFVSNTVYGMPCISFLLADNSDPHNICAEYPSPFEEDYGTGYPCAYTYTFNLAGDVQCSEFGDAFFEKRVDGFYHRVS